MIDGVESGSLIVGSVTVDAASRGGGEGTVAQVAVALGARNRRVASVEWEAPLLVRKGNRLRLPGFRAVATIAGKAKVACVRIAMAANARAG